MIMIMMLTLRDAFVLQIISPSIRYLSSVFASRGFILQAALQSIWRTKSPSPDCAEPYLLTPQKNTRQENEYENEKSSPWG